MTSNLGVPNMSGNEKSYIIEKKKLNEGKTYHWRTSAIYKSRRSQNSDVLFENVTYKNGRPRKGSMRKCLLTVIWSFLKTEIKEETITYIRVARLMLDYELSSLPHKKETKPMIHERKVAKGEVKWLEEKEDSLEEINENNNNNIKSNKRTSIVSSTISTPANFEDTGFIMDAVKEVCDVIANTKTMVNKEYESNNEARKNESSKSNNKNRTISEDSKIAYTGTNYTNASSSNFETENVTLLPDIITTTQSPNMNLQQQSFNNLTNDLMTKKLETDYEMDDVMEYKKKNEKQKLHDSFFPISTAVSNVSKNTVHFMCGSFGQDRSIKELHVARGSSPMLDEDIYTSDSSFKSTTKETLFQKHTKAQQDLSLDFSSQMKPDKRTGGAFDGVQPDVDALNKAKPTCLENNKSSFTNRSNINTSTDISMDEEWMDCKDWDERVQPFATSSPKFEDYYDDYSHLPHNMKFEKSHETKPKDTWFFNTRKETESKIPHLQAPYSEKPFKSSPSSSSYYSPYQSPHLPQNNSQYNSHQISSSSITSDYYTPNLLPSPKLSSSPSGPYETCASEESDKNSYAVDTLKRAQLTFTGENCFKPVEKISDDNIYDNKDTCVCDKGVLEDGNKNLHDAKEVYQSFKVSVSQANKDDEIEISALTSNQEVTVATPREEKNVEKHFENVFKSEGKVEVNVGVLDTNEKKDHSMEELSYVNSKNANQKQEKNELTQQLPSETLPVNFAMVGTKVRDRGDDNDDDDDDENDNDLTKKPKSNKSFDNIDITSIGFNKSNIASVNNFETEETQKTNLSFKNENLIENDKNINEIDDSGSKILPSNYCFDSNKLKTDSIERGENKIIELTYTSDECKKNVDEFSDDHMSIETNIEDTVNSAGDSKTCDNYEVSASENPFTDSMLNVFTDNGETYNIGEEKDLCGVDGGLVSKTDANGEQKLRNECGLKDDKNVDENVFCSKSLDTLDEAFEINRGLTDGNVQDKNLGKKAEKKIETGNNKAKKVENIRPSQNVVELKNVVSDKNLHEKAKISDDDSHKKDNLKEEISHAAKRTLKKDKVDNKDDLETEIDAYFETNNENSHVVKALDKNADDKDCSPCSSISLSDFDNYGIVERKSESTKKNIEAKTTCVSEKNLTRENKNGQNAKVIDDKQTDYIDGEDIKKSKGDSSSAETSPLTIDKISNNLSNSVLSASLLQLSASTTEISNVGKQDFTDKNGKRRESNTKSIEDVGPSEKNHFSSPFLGGFEKIIFDFFKNEKEIDKTKNEENGINEAVSKNAEYIQNDNNFSYKIKNQNETSSSTSQIEATLNDPTSTKTSTITFYDFHLNNKPYNYTSACEKEGEDDEEEEEKEEEEEEKEEEDGSDGNSEEVGSDIRIIKTASSNSNEMIIQVI